MELIILQNELEVLASDAVEVTYKTLISAIPIGGPLAVNIWDAVQNYSLKKRREKWQKMVEIRLSHIEKTLEEVGENENFTSAIMKATETAIRTADSDKMTFLADAVANSLESTLDESRIMIFLNLVDKYTAWHLKILHYFRNPTAFEDVKMQKYYMGSPEDPLLDHFPDLKEWSGQLIDKIVKDLYNDGMLDIASLHGTMSPSGMVASRTTELGNEFIDFITKR